MTFDRISIASLALLLAVGCASQGPLGAASGGGPGSGGTGGGATDSGGGGSAGDASPTFTAEQWQMLRELAPPRLPAPIADVSNAHADDARAAALGKKIFLDTGFSGRLLDIDNNGGPNTLGTRGQTGRVACAGCHIPAATFSDNRSAFGEISLGAGWTRRRSPSLLDVGQAKLVMWGDRFTTL